MRRVDEPSGRRHNGRPLIITITCILIFVSFALSLPSVPRLASVIAEVFGAGYMYFWFALLLLTFASAVGYWRMRRWGVYLYASGFVVGTSWGVIEGIPFSTAGVLVPVAICAMGVGYFHRMK